MSVTTRVNAPECICLWIMFAQHLVHGLGTSRVGSCPVCVFVTVQAASSGLLINICVFVCVCVHRLCWRPALKLRVALGL